MSEQPPPAGQPPGPQAEPPGPPPAPTPAPPPPTYVPPPAAPPPSYVPPPPPATPAFGGPGAGPPPFPTPGPGGFAGAQPPFPGPAPSAGSGPASGYGPPPGYPQQPVPYGPGSVSPPANSSALTGLIVGIVALVLGFTCLAVPWLAGIASIILGGKAKREIRASGGAQGGEGLATASQVMGWVCLGLFALGVLVFIVVIAGLATHSGSFQRGVIVPVQSSP